MRTRRAYPARHKDIAADISLTAHWLKGAGGGLAIQGLGLLLGFSAVVVAARFLGPDLFGQYAYALAAAGAASVPAALGLPSAITKFIAVYHDSKEWGLARGLLLFSVRRVALAGTGFALLIVALGILGWQGERFWVFLCAAPIVPIFALIALSQKTLQGLHYPVYAQVPLQVLKPAAFLAIAGSMWLMGTRAVRVPQGLVTMQLAAGALVCGAAAVLVWKKSPARLRVAQPHYAVDRWLRVAVPLLVADSVGVAYAASDTLLLGALRSAEEVGLYQVGLRVAGAMAMLLGASNWVLAPWFARLFEGSDLERLQRVVTRSTRAVFSLSLVLFIGLVLWGEYFLQVAFGAPYVRAYGVLLVLAAGRLVDVGAGPVVNLLTMTGGQRVLAATVGAAALVNMTACMVLIPRLGMLGAALSSATVVACTNLYLSWVVRKRIGIASTLFGG